MSPRLPFALLLAPILFSMGQAFVNVVLPPLGRRLGFEDLHTGALLSTAALILMLTAPAWGYASERIGRRPVLLAGIAGAALCAAGLAVAVHWKLTGAMGVGAAFTLVFALRVLQAASTSGLVPATQAWIADATTPERRAVGMGALGASMGTGAILSSMLAWRVGGAAPVAAFSIIAALACIAFVAILAGTREPAHAPRTGSASARLPLERLWPCYLVTLTGIAAYSVVQQVTAWRLQDALGYTVEQSISRAGAALTSTALAIILVQAVVVRLLDWTPRRMMTVGALIAAVAIALCGFVDRYAALVATLTLAGVGLGFLLTGNLATLSLHTGAHAQGKAAGVNVLAQGFGLTIGPIAGAALHANSVGMPFAGAAVLLCGSLAASLLAPSPPRSVEAGVGGR